MRPCWRATSTRRLLLLEWGSPTTSTTSVGWISAILISFAVSRAIHSARPGEVVISSSE